MFEVMEYYHLEICASVWGYRSYVQSQSLISSGAFVFVRLDGMRIESVEHEGSARNADDLGWRNNLSLLTTV